MASVAAGNGGAAAGDVAHHVLVVDDGAVERHIMTAILKRSKCKVTAVDGGKKALEVLEVEKKNIKMIFTDFTMPEMTGFDLLKKIKESSELEEIPVVVMSSENIASRINSCLEEGAVDFILKPVKIPEVSRLCSKFLK